jgi:hypothetical protein
MLHSETHPINLPLSRFPPCQAAYTTPSSATQHHVKAFGTAQRIDCLLWGLRNRSATLKKVFTEISTPMRRPRRNIPDPG